MSERSGELPPTDQSRSASWRRISLWASGIYLGLLSLAVGASLLLLLAALFID